MIGRGRPRATAQVDAIVKEILALAGLDVTDVFVDGRNQTTESVPLSVMATLMPCSRKDTLTASLHMSGEFIYELSAISRNA